MSAPEPGVSMRRREFISLIGSVAAAWPLAARAQKSAVPVIGFVGVASAELFAGPARAFRQGLNETNYAEGRDFFIEERWAQGHNDRLPGLIADMVQRQVSVLVTTTTPGALAAKAATKTIPVVFAIGSDPVKDGIVPSLNRPAGNVTGVTALTSELGPKRLEIIGQVVPAGSLALLVNRNNTELAESQSVEMQAAAHALGRQLHILHAGTEGELEQAFADLAKLHVGALIISADGFFTSHSDELANLALRHGMPAVYQNRAFARAGGFMSYGASTADAWRLAGVYTGRILGGEQPADLPVQQASKVELAVNLKTAKALNLTVPPSLLARADEVIE